MSLSTCSFLPVHFFLFELLLDISKKKHVLSLSLSTLISVVAGCKLISVAVVVLNARINEAKRTYLHCYILQFMLLMMQSI